MANKLKLPEMKSVQSSQIASIGYDKDNSRLFITFKRGGTYSYHPITEAGHKALVEADSIGSYFHNNIRSNERITTEKISA